MFDRIYDYLTAAAQIVLAVANLIALVCLGSTLLAIGSMAYIRVVEFLAEHL